MTASHYLEALKTLIALSDVVSDVEIVREYVLESQGFFRARLWLRNGDFLEISEYFVVQESGVQVVQYRYQWMDATRTQLRKRWNNAPHHPEIEGFPHHVHNGSDDHVQPGHSMNLLQLFRTLEEEIER